MQTVADQFAGTLAKGVRLKDPADVEDGRAAAPAHDGRALIGAVVNRAELARPPAITLEMANGFSLYMVNAPTSGRGDQLIELAKSVIWR